MKVSIFLAHLSELASQKGCTFGAAVREAKRSGIDYVEVDYKYAAGRADELKAMLDSAGLQVGGLNTWFDFTHLSQPELIESAVETAKKLNAAHIMAVPGFVNPGEKWEVLREKLAAGLNELMTAAARQSVSVAMEDFDGVEAPYGRMDELNWVLHQVPGLGCCFDTGNFLFFGEDVLKAYDLLEKRIVHVHMKDIAFAPLRGEKGKEALTGKKLYPAPVGSGELPMAEIVRRLYERGYSGIFAIEHFSAGDQLLFMRRSARWLNNIFR